MAKVLQRYKDKVLQALEESRGGLSFSRLQSNASLVSHVLENVVGELRQEGLITLYHGQFHLSREFNQRFRHAEAKTTPKSIRRAENGSKQKALKKALEDSTVGGVECFEYKSNFLQTLVDTFKGKDDRIANDIAAIREDFVKLVQASEESNREAA